jgi:cell division protein FtsW (lipid II flippase)
MIALHLGRLVLGFRRGEARLGFGDLLERSPVQAQRVGLLLILVVFIALVPWLGTTLGVFLSLLALMLTLGVRSWRRLLLISLAVATTVYLLFMLLLQSRLPSGPVEEALGRLFGGGS